MLLNGTPMAGRSWSPARRGRAGVRRSFQSLELFEDISVAENLHAGAGVRTRFAGLRDLVWPARPPLPPTAVSSAREFGLEHDLDRLPGELPYGRRRLVGIARAIASAPSVLLLDEPAAGLDDNETSELGELVRRFADERGMAVLLIEHDVELVLRVCDRIVVLDFGRKIAEGTPARDPQRPAVIAAYLGEEMPDGRRGAAGQRAGDGGAVVNATDAALTGPVARVPWPRRRLRRGGGRARPRPAASSRARSSRSSDRTAPGRRRRC